MKLLSIVIPIHNEEGNIHTLYSRLLENLKNLKNYKYEIIFIDDYSTDNSIEKIIKLREKNKNVKLIELSKNFGHQIALSAGLHHSKGNATIMMDGDLQHPPELIPKLINAYEKGNEIVYTKRKESDDSSLFKRLSAKLFYKLFNAISEVKITTNSADFRLISKKVLKAFNHINEKKRFLRGLFPSMGFPSTTIEFKADNRFSGKSSYTLSKMIKLCSIGLTSFSGKPLRIPLYFGILTTIGALIYSAFIVVAYLQGKAIAGWSSVVISILFLSSIQLIFLGIIGEYLYIIFNEIKKRPLYFIQKKHGFDDHKN